MTKKMEVSDGASGKPRIQSIGRGFAVLFAIARSERGLKARDISDELGLDRQTTYHILQSLSAIGMISRSAENRYILGLKIGEIVESFSRHLAPPERLTPLVRAVAKETGETSYAVGWMGDEIVVLGTARGTNSVSVSDTPHGHASDAHARASGKLLLALAEPHKSADYLGRHELRKLTPNTLTDPSALRNELNAIREKRISIEREEFAKGVSCIAVPIAGFGTTHALAISVPSERFEQNLIRYEAIMLRIAAGILPERA